MSTKKINYPAASGGGVLGERENGVTNAPSGGELDPKRLKIGILSPSEIAFRRFVPAIKKCDEFEFVGVAVAEKSEWFGEVSNEVIKTERNKAEKFISEYGGRIFNSYRELIDDDSVECIYIPLPPALHYSWAKQALSSGKHVLLEKPFTVNEADSNDLIRLAKEKSLVIHENYMFVYHSQVKFIQNQIEQGTIGELRLIRLDFTFPFRGNSDFRYVKELGGGALLDCGGYPIKLASVLLGDTAEVVYSQLNSKPGFDVDIFGNAVIRNNDGLSAQISFGMDNNYLCRIEVLGSKGYISTNRIFTAPDEFCPIIKVNSGNEEQEVVINAESSFLESMRCFYNCIVDPNNRQDNYNSILVQSRLIELMKNQNTKL